MLRISRGTVKISGFAIVTFAVVAACSSSSGTSEFSDSDAAAVDAAPPTCTEPITIGSGNDQTNTYPGGACDASVKGVSCNYEPAPTCGFDGTIWTCTCDGTNWTCSITGGGFGGGRPCAIEDAGSDAEESDAQEDADLDASDADAF